jgi:hypothetical protein
MDWEASMRTPVGVVVALVLLAGPGGAQEGTGGRPPAWTKERLWSGPLDRNPNKQGGIGDGLDDALERSVRDCQPERGLRVSVVFDGRTPATPARLDGLRLVAPPYCSTALPYCAANLACEDPDSLLERLRGYVRREGVVFVFARRTLRTALPDSLESVRVSTSNAYPTENLWVGRNLKDGKNWPAGEVAVFDTGVHDGGKDKHERLEPALLSLDCVHQDRSLIGCQTVTSDMPDLTGHGTRVAVAALGRKPDGSRKVPTGVCPFCALVDVRVLGQDGKGDPAAVEAALVELMRLKAAGKSNVQVAVMAFAADEGTDGTDPLSIQVDAALEADIVVVAAMGNEKAQRVPPPAAASGSVAVAGMDTLETPRRQDDVWWAASNRGPRMDCADPTRCVPVQQKPDVAGPAVKVCVPSRVSGYCSAKPGTSIATALVGGLAGAVRALAPKIHARDVAAALRDSAGGPSVGACASRWSPQVGCGLVDAWGALKLLEAR